MAKFNIAFDNADADLGGYFEKSKDDLTAYIQNNYPHFAIHQIPANILNQAYIDIHLPTVNSSNYIFVAYSHGRTDCLTQNGNYYIKSPTNSYLFSNCLFYSMACYSANELGKDIIDNCGGLAYIGYDDEVNALLGGYIQTSIDCDNFGE